MKKLVLPFPPSINNYYRPVRAGHGATIKLKQPAKDYRKRVVAMLRGVGQPLGGRLDVRVTLNPNNEGDWDLDNRMKGLLDALEHAGVFVNDSQIDRLEIIRGVVSTPATAIVEIGVIRK